MPIPPPNITPTSVDNTAPSGLDRADGSEVNGVQFPGTATPQGVIFVKTPSGAYDVLDFLDGTATVFEEYPDSPEIERAEQATITHRFICDEYTGGILIRSYYSPYHSLK